MKPHYQRGVPFHLTAAPQAVRADTKGSEAASASELASLRSAAKGRSGAAAPRLGRAQLATEEQTREGLAWLKRAADAGQPAAAHLLGLAYFQGKGVERDLAAARRLQREAAEAGSIDAQFELSLLLAQGIGGPRDARGARRWEKRAAEAGHPRACLNRGARFAAGKRPDFATAADWYTRAAEFGSAEAAARLCQMHLAGQGVVRDEATARRWFSRAAELGWNWAVEQG